MSRLAVMVLSSICVVLVAGCRNQNRSMGTGSEGDTITVKSSLLTIVEYPGYTIADVANPWNPQELMQRYVLVDSGSGNGALPDGTIIETPLKTSLVYSSVHAGVIKELGKINAVTAICDAQYYKVTEILDGLKNGTIADAGSSMSPSIELILNHQPQTILASPFQNAGHGAIERLGIPIIECADYMESSPLGRAEWIKLIGRLYGNSALADSLFMTVADNYASLVSLVADVNCRPTVVSEMVTDGVWYVPGGASYMSQMFSDAGAAYPWQDDKSSGSLQLDFATVYERAHDADFWIIKTFDSDMTLSKLKENYPLHERMRAFHSGGVYSCNTATSSFFEDFPFHPDLLLHEFINIFHPGVLPDSTLRYYRQVK